MKIDATLIHGLLYQGGWPSPGHGLMRAGFKTLVLCAREFQPPFEFPDGMGMLVGLRAQNPYPGVKVIYAPNDDNPFEPPKREDLAVAVKAAREVADGLKDGRKTLVTCWAGRNRSGLVSSLALHLLLGIPGEKAVAMVKRARKPSLTNGQFVEVLSRLT